MAFKLISLDICKNLEKNGKNEVARLAKTVSQALHGSNSHRKKGDVMRLFYELCWQSINGNLKQDSLITALSDIVQTNADLPNQLIDAFVLLDIETQCTPDSREKFLQLLFACSKTVVPEHLIKERLDIETAGEASILKSTKAFQTKFIKIKTRLFYKQQKFNLFREESEGYAKLITELNQDTSRGKHLSPAHMLEVMQSLIGCFNLDPNRVLDIVLESFECNLDLAAYFIGLLESFLCNSTTLSQVLGFKFGFYQNDGSAETPSKFYKVVALLLQNGLVTLDQIYYVLTPDDNKISEQHKQDLQDARVYARKMTMIATSSAAESTTPSSSNASNPKTITATTEEPVKTDEVDLEKPWFEENQKLGLIGALLEIGDWERAKKLMDRLPDFFATSQPHIAKKLCQLVHYIIDIVYRKYSGLPSVLKHNYNHHFKSNIPVRQITVLGELQVVLPILFSLGPHLYLDPVLMVKIVRLTKAFLTPKHFNRQPNTLEKGVLEYDILTLLDEVLLPSLSLMDCNCCMAEEIWSLVRLFPYQHRYRLYGQWKNEAHLTHPLLIKTKADTLKKIKYIMKRLSKENVKPSGRQIGKLSHSNPGFLFDYILSQIQTWDNLINPVVDSLKYLTSLSYDVLAYCIIEGLSNPDKERYKLDGTTISLWLQSLANFCGAIFRKYPIDLTGLLQFIANQLKAEKSLDLLLLKEIIQKMAGIEASDEMTNEQLEAMAGGELLKAEGGYFTQLRNTKKPSQRLKEALLEQDLALPLCILMAQQRNCILFREQEYGHLKLVGKLFDQCQDTLVQYGSFLAICLNMDDYSQRLPSIDRLLSEYHISADVAFFLTRPMLSHSVTSKYEELRKQDKIGKNSSSSQKLQKYLEAMQFVAKPIMQAVCNNSGTKICEDLSSSFYVMFWSMSLYDLHVPSSSYEREINKLKSQIKQIDDNKELVASKKKKEKERCHALIEKLQDEEKKQQEHCSRVLAMLKAEKDTWFQSRSAKNEMITQFLQLCIFPRCIFTSVDALYCAKFVHLIHNLKTSNFSTLICYDRIFCDISYTVSSCTENEANRYGKFLCAMLETVMHWHSDKSVFDQECTNYPGFMTKFKGSTQSQVSSNDHVDYENYRHVCHKWHFRITKALVIGLESGDYIQIRNTLIILTKVITHFPVITNLGLALERRVEKIRAEEKDKRADLFALATGYLGQLKAKKNALIPEFEFHIKETNKENEASQKNVSKENASNSETKSEPKEIKTETGVKVPSKISGSTKSTISLSNKSSSETITVAAVKEEIVSVRQRLSESTSGSAASLSKDGKRSSLNTAGNDHHHHDAENNSLSDSTTSSGHAIRRSAEVASDVEKGHKRRRMELNQTKIQKAQDEAKARKEVSPAETDRASDMSSSSVTIGESRSSSRERSSSNKEKTPGRENSLDRSATSGSASVHSPEKNKSKEKKLNRKRLSLNAPKTISLKKGVEVKDHNGSGSAALKRRKDEESGVKVATKQNDGSETKHRIERHRIRVESVTSKSRGERRSEKEDKKHHRSSSGSNSAVIQKKRS